jgi:hypothetical protein
MGFDTDVATGLRFGTNATLLQVAAGVIAGWSQLGRTRGVHFVEDLDPREFVRDVSELLGRRSYFMTAPRFPSLLRSVSAGRRPSNVPAKRQHSAHGG